MNVRNRRIISVENVDAGSSSENDISTRARKKRQLISWSKSLGLCCFIVAVVVSILGYLETRVNTPFDEDKIVRDTGNISSERFWGTYRPGVYMGMKGREPRSPVFGFMWYELLSSPSSQHKGVRHWCDQGDKLPRYGWIRHDGSTFGEQVIVDPPHKIVTSFLKTAPTAKGSHWTVRINVTSTVEKSPFGLIWYAALDEVSMRHARLELKNGAIQGYTPSLDKFNIKFENLHGHVYHASGSEAASHGLHSLKEKTLGLMRMETHPDLGHVTVLRRDSSVNEENPVTFVPMQLVVEPPFAIDILFTAEGVPSKPLSSEDYTEELAARKKKFDEKFQTKFNLSERGYTPEEVVIAKGAMSNMIGGIGYFYGAGRVQSEHTKEPVPYWRAPLYTAVPSRSFFPRGFLWDEGFHLQLISRWSPDIAMDIAAHWLDLTNVEGWIPREQILGTEAVARVPKEFVVQSNAHANPPMLLVTLGGMVRSQPELFQPYKPHRLTLSRMYSRLQAWFNWFQNTQKGIEPTTYRWRGRVDDGRQLNPKSLSSGLDDYPRASHPTDLERHLDLRCWMYAAADAMATIANVLQVDSSKYEEMRSLLSDEELLNDLHWSTQSETYADYGLHTDGVRLARKKPKHPSEQGEVVRLVSAAPQQKLVTSAFGYISLFPMLLKVLNPNSEKLGKIFETLDKPELLWSPYGLRSLSKSAPLYMKRNTESDPPYWRGQVWINMNFLALSALKHYSREGIHAARAGELHDRLRENIVRNLIKEYKRTGYLWEQYSGEDGKGSGCRPFTGWTALLVLIMAEDY